MVVRVETNGRKVTGLTWLDAENKRHTESGDLVVLAANSIETARLALLSGLPDPYDLAGRRVMFHWFSEGSGIFLSERLHNYRGRDHTHDIDDFADPDFPGAREVPPKRRACPISVPARSNSVGPSCPSTKRAATKKCSACSRL